MRFKRHRWVLPVAAGFMLSLTAQAFAETEGASFRKKNPRAASPGSSWSITGGLFGSFNYRVSPEEFTGLPRKKMILTYQPDRLYRLGDVTLPQPGQDGPVFGSEGVTKPDTAQAVLPPAKLDDSLAQTIFDLLKAGHGAVKVTKQQNAAIVTFYKKRGFQAVWGSIYEGVDPKSQALLALMRKAGEEGLDPDDYDLPVLQETAGDLEPVESDIEKLARFDVELTALALRYAAHANSGRVHPNRLTRYHDLKTPKLNLAAALNRIATDAEPAGYAASLHPVHPAYKAMKKALAVFDGGALKPGEVYIPAGPSLRVGSIDDRVPLLRARMIKLGHLNGTGERSEDSQGDLYFDEGLSAAIKTFQGNSGLWTDGIVGPQTLRVLNKQKKRGSRKHLVYNMERMRWLPRQFGRKHIIVNQPEFRVRVMKEGRQVWTSKVIVGKYRHQTSFFSDEMETVVFNPYWNVPASILNNEMLPQLRANPGYLDQKGFELFDRRGRRVSSYSVDWYQYGGKIPFTTRQPPGYRNALGELKFLFPNKHHIYMHDTPTKPLFSRPVRTFSHGCVRVQNPRELAEAVLGWDQTKIASTIRRGENNHVTLENKIPVHITYFTAWPGDDGKIRYLDDIYKRDELIGRALNSRTIASN